jgi:hypothetical protein
MIASILGGIVASPWMRAALRYGAITLTVLLFLLALRRSGERVGRMAERNVSTTLRQWHLDFRLDFPPLSLVG